MHRTQSGAMLTLVTGPVRSGKSRFALELAHESGHVPVYVATAEIDPHDREMTDRVAQHRAERGAMRTIETHAAGPRLGDAIAAIPAGEVAIVDSVGTWLGSCMMAAAGAFGDDALAAAAALEREAGEVLGALAAARGDVILVAEETGWGVVPPYPLGRAFRDQLGRLTAALAGRCDRVYLVVAGYAIDLRVAGRRVSDRSVTRGAR